MQDRKTEKLQTFSLRLRGLAENRNLSQAQIAEALSVSPSRVGHWFQGKNFPKDHAPLLAKLLRVSVDFLLYGIEQETEKLSPVSAVQDEIASNYSAITRDRLIGRFNALLDAAGDDPARLGWISEQMALHLQTPVHWQSLAERTAAAYARAADMAREYGMPEAQPPHDGEAGKHTA